MPPAPRIDFLAILMLIGVAQSFFIGGVLFSSPPGRQLAHRTLGLILLTVGITNLEILLCYTGWIVDALWLLDLTQGFTFALAPLVYFYIRVQLFGTWGRWAWPQFTLVPLYLVNSAFTISTQPRDVLLYRYMAEWHPNQWQGVIPEAIKPYDPFNLQGYPNVILMVQLAVYLTLAFLLVRRAFQSRNLHMLGPAEAKLHWLRIIILALALSFILIIIARTAFSHDLGDYLIVVYFTGLSFCVTAFYFRDSRFLVESPVKGDSVPQAEKYRSSSLTPERAAEIVTRLNALDAELLDPDLSLPVLAELVGAAPHHLSQVLNGNLSQSFFEYLAARRIAAAQQLLQLPAGQALKLEEVAERVGFNSRSAFVAAFKRLAGTTPSDYRKQFS